MKAAVFLLVSLLVVAARAGAQTLPASTVTPPAASPVATPPASVVPAATLPNPHRVIRELKTDADNIKSQGNFGAQLWLIADERFFQNWRKPDSPSIDPVETAVRGQPIFTVIVFYGPARDEKGQADVTYDLLVRRPDGTVYSDCEGVAGYQAAAPGDERMLTLGRGYLNIDLAPGDPAGRYTVEAAVHDVVGKLDLKLRKEFTVE